jgi:ribose transport system permease protein
MTSDEVAGPAPGNSGPSSESLLTPIQREQFSAADLHGKMVFFETCLAAHRLDALSATEMLAAIHRELETPQRQDHTVYARYAFLMETLRQTAPDMYQAVVDLWKNRQEAEVAAEAVRSTAAIPERSRGNVKADEGHRKARLPSRGRPGLIRRLLSIPELGVGLAAVVAFAFFTASDQSMLTPGNLSSLVTRSSFIGFAALGMSVLMQAGEIDFSAGAAASFAFLIYAILGSAGWSEPASLVGALLAAATIGWINSFLVLEIGLPSFLATLSTYIVVSSLGPFLYGLAGAAGRASFAGLGAPSPLFGASWAFVALLAAVAAGEILIRGTRLGPLLWATGANPQAATAVGINTAGVKTFCFMFCSVCAAIGGFLVFATMNLAPSYAEDWQVWVPAIAIIGGASLRGASGSLLGALLGTLLLLTIRTGLIAANIFSNGQGVVVGGILVAAIVVDSLRRKTKRGW